MPTKSIALLVAAFFLAGATFVASAGDDKASAKEKKALQGSWTATKGDEKMKMTFEGNKFKLEFKGESATGTFTVDPSKTPKAMDLTVVKGTGENTMRFEGKTSKAIYAIDGNKLKWLANEPGKGERPKALPKDGESPMHLYLVLERDKK